MKTMGCIRCIQEKYILCLVTTFPLKLFPSYVHFLSIILTFPSYISNQGHGDTLESIPCSTTIALLYQEESIYGQSSCFHLIISLHHVSAEVKNHV